MASAGCTAVLPWVQSSVNCVDVDGFATAVLPTSVNTPPISGMIFQSF